jgi:hypothetical protein
MSTIRCLRLLVALGILLPAVLAAGQEPPAPEADGTPAAGEAPAPAAAPAPGEAGARTVELHAGLPGMAFIGQTLEDLLKRFPGADVQPFAGQDDAVTVKVPAAGISCIAVGAPDKLKVASVGFNLDGTYEGISEGNFRTAKGIGKGSTVNDLIEAYGPPADMVSSRPRGSPPPRPGTKVDPSLPQKYQYENETGAIRTYFLIENYRVTRIVVNELKSLEQHLIKARPKS